MMHTWLYKRTEKYQRIGQRTIMIQLLDIGYPHSNTPDKRLKTWGFQLKGSIEMWITTLKPPAIGFSWNGEIRNKTMAVMVFLNNFRNQFLTKKAVNTIQGSSYLLLSLKKNHPAPAH